MAIFQIHLHRPVTLLIFSHVLKKNLFYTQDAMLVQVLAMALCLSVSVTSRVLSKWLNDLCRFLAWELPSTYPALC